MSQLGQPGCHRIVKYIRPVALRPLLSLGFAIIQMLQIKCL